MDRIHRIKTISEFHRSRGLPEPDHPLISVVDYTTIRHKPEIMEVGWVFDFYFMALKRNMNGVFKYGQQEYDFDEGVMFFIAPHQVFHVAVDPEDSPQRSGWMLLIHPDFLWNTSLAGKMKEYDFFDYSVNEALFLSKKEEATMLGIIENIRQEYHANIDTFSQQIIVSQIETLLNYGQRFYHRQFITRKKSNHQVLEQLEQKLADYFDGDDLINKGLPTVQQIAEELHLSPNYLSSLLKVLTGQTTQQHIHNKLVERAKQKLSTTQLSVTEIAYELGFEHSQSFSKLFKNKTKLSPTEFRRSFN